MVSSMIHLYLTFSAIILLYVHALNLDSAYESECFELEGKSVAVNEEWLDSVNLWYFTYGSQADVYLTAGDTSGKKLEDLTQADLDTEFCPVFLPNENGLSAHAFGNEVQFDVSPITGSDGFNICNRQGKYCGTGHYTLTDNKTFAVSSHCIGEGKHKQMTWCVLSTQNKLSNAARKLIFEKQASLGFKRDKFTEIKFDKCNVNHF